MPAASASKSLQLGMEVLATCICATLAPPAACLRLHCRLAAACHPAASRAAYLCLVAPITCWSHCFSAVLRGIQLLSVPAVCLQDATAAAIHAAAPAPTLARPLRLAQPTQERVALAPPAQQVWGPGARQAAQPQLHALPRPLPQPLSLLLGAGAQLQQVAESESQQEPQQRAQLQQQVSGGCAGRAWAAGMWWGGGPSWSWLLALAGIFNCHELMVCAASE